MQLETYEWDKTWIEKTEDISSKRVLYIGDSISCGIREALGSLPGREMLFDGFGTSKALDNPCYFPALSLFASQEHHRDAVIFNNGLHGWHIDEQRYSELYDEFLDKLLKEFSNTLIIPVLTTFVTDPDYRNERVIKRNIAVKKLAEAKKLPVIDLYAVSEKNRVLQSTDGVHFTDEGYKVLANKVLCALKNFI